MKCKECDGTGELYHFGSCARCNGTGIENGTGQDNKEPLDVESLLETQEIQKKIKDKSGIELIKQ